jgi:hypothetical protein
MTRHLAKSDRPEDPYRLVCRDRGSPPGRRARLVGASAVIRVGAVPAPATEIDMLPIAFSIWQNST